MSEEQGLTSKQKTFIFCGALIVFAATIKYATDANKHKKRQKAIEEYVERIGLLEAAKRRLIRIMNDPTKTEDDFLDAVEEEKKFLGIVSDPE